MCCHSYLCLIILCVPQVFCGLLESPQEIGQNAIEDSNERSLNLNPITAGPDFNVADLSRDVVEWAYTWPNGIVYYEISPEFNESSKQLVYDAMKEVSDKTCIIFKKHTNEPDYIYFRKLFGDGCHTHAGRKGGKQVVNLDPQRCIQHGKIMHELLHVVGFHHEHQRPDRDNFIEIFWDNIKPGDWVQMQIFDAKKRYMHEFPYDYSSILHYGNESFFLAVDRSKPILAAKRLAPEMGQRKYLSDVDVKKVNFLYNCDKRVK